MSGSVHANFLDVCRALRIAQLWVPVLVGEDGCQAQTITKVGCECAGYGKFRGSLVFWVYDFLAAAQGPILPTRHTRRRASCFFAAGTGWRRRDTVPPDTVHLAQIYIYPRSHLQLRPPPGAITLPSLRPHKIYRHT